MSKFLLTGLNQTASGGITLNEPTASMALGAKIEANDGSIWRYVKAGATALVPGKLYDGPATISTHTNIAVAAAAVAGATSITVTLGATAAAADQYAGGVVAVNDEDGEGETYSIASHPAADASASLVLTLDAVTPIVTALTTSSQVTLIPNEYHGVVIHAQSETGVPAGVAKKAITALYYGFIKTRGATAVLHDGSPAAIGQQVDASTTTDGAVTLGTVATAGIGYALAQGVSTEYNPVFLTID